MTIARQMRERKSGEQIDARKRSTAPWKDYKCEGCRGEFTRRAIVLPKLCFHCEWLRSDAKKQIDLDAFDPSI